MSRSKAKSNYKISLPEAILNLSNINYKSKDIAQCLSMAFAKKIEQKYVVKVIQNNERRLERNVFKSKLLNKKISSRSRSRSRYGHGTKWHGTVRSVTVWYERSRSRAKNETFTVLI